MPEFAQCDEPSLCHPGYNESGVPGAGWNVEMELFPTGDQTNVLPFTVQNLGRQNLFLRAEDWTGVDGDGDGLADAWEWQYFGTLALCATNRDAANNCWW